MFTINCGGKIYKLDNPWVMGIINATPDSFVEGHLQKGMDGILHLAEKMIADGADIIDVGGQSTRPGSKAISSMEEINRVIPVIEILRKNFPDVLISIDSFYSKVAYEAVQAGANLVNDISGGSLDEDMIATVANLRVPYICMHTRGTPQTMQNDLVYENLLNELINYFIAKINECRKAGINDIIIDPGFGFAKSIEQNFEILRSMDIFKMLNVPLLAGLSRKSSIYKTLGIDVSEALNGTTVLNSFALMHGASILRVHDVKEARQAIILFEKMKGQA